jgi:hypothetical protein
VVGAANDGFRFLLELAALVAVALWGFQAASGAARWIVGLGAPLALATVWVLAVNPDGSLTPGDPWRLLIEIAVFGAASLALRAAGRPRPAIALVALVALHLALTFALDQR